MPRLTDILQEGASIIDGHYHAVYLGGGDYCIGFVIPVDAPWVTGELREVLYSLLDEPSPLTSRSSTPWMFTINQPQGVNHDEIEIN